MKSQKILTAGLAVVATLTFTAACSDNNDGATEDATPTSSTAGSAADSGGTSVTDPSQPPSAATLNTLLTKALDPNVPASQKTNLVQGASADPQLFDKLVKARQANPTVTYQLQAPVIATGNGQATVKVRVKLPDAPQQTIDAAIVYDQGSWKLARTTVCPLLQTSGVTSPICSGVN